MADQITELFRKILQQAQNSMNVHTADGKPAPAAIIDGLKARFNAVDELISGAHDLRSCAEFRELYFK